MLSTRKDHYPIQRTSKDRAMKRLLILLFFAFFAITTQAQTVPNLPPGSVPFGTGLFRAPDGDIWGGSKFDQYVNLGNWQRVADSLGAKINWSDTTIIASKEWVEGKLNSLPPSGVLSVTGDGVDNTDPANPVISYPDPSDIGALAPGDNVSELTNDAGYLDSETDPVYSGDPASGITQNDIDAWDAKQDAITGAATTVVSNNLTPSRALISNGSGKIEVSPVSSTELAFLDGVTSNVQDQLDNNTIKPGEVKPSDLGYVSGGNYLVPLFSTDANIWHTPPRASQQAISSTIAIRHLSGRLKAGNAVDNDDVVTLRQLRDSINAIPSNQIFQSCVVRFNGEKWVVINDGTHVPMNIDSVTNGTNPSFNFWVYYGSSHIEDVGSVIGVIDESYASLGYFVGATVGLEYAAFRITAKGLYAKVFYDGDSWEMDSSQYNTVRPEAFSFSFNPANGNLTISHNDVIIPYDFLTVQSGSGYTPILVSKTYTSVTIRFEDNGSPVLIPDTNMIVEMYRNGVYHVKNSVMPFSTPTGSPNIWVQGMHVRQ